MMFVFIISAKSDENTCSQEAVSPKEK